MQHSKYTAYYAVMATRIIQKVGLKITFTEILLKELPHFSQNSGIFRTFV